MGIGHHTILITDVKGRHPETKNPCNHFPQFIYQKMENSIPVRLKTLDEATGQYKLSQVIEIVHDYAMCLGIMCRRNQNIVCTPDTEILTDRGWVRAGEIKIGDGIRWGDRSEVTYLYVKEEPKEIGYPLAVFDFKLLNGTNIATYTAIYRIKDEANDS